MKTDFPALTSFRAARQEAGLPVATEAQVRRARQAIERNPTIRSFYSPLGLEMLALGLPLDRNERRALAKEGAVKYEPIRTRTTELEELGKTPAVAAQFFEAVGPVDEQHWLDAVCQAKSIDRDVLARQGRRIARFFKGGRVRRVPAHIREMMATMGVAAYGIDRLSAAAVA